MSVAEESVAESSTTTEHKPQWNEALENILKKEGEQAEALFWMHNQAAAWAARRNDLIQIPTILLATITGFLSATSDLVPPVGIGAASVVVGALGTINSYYKFSQRAEGHRITSLWYMKTYKDIECQLALPIHQRVEASALLKTLRDGMSRVSETAPALPEFAIAAFNKKFRGGTTSVPIVANGLDPIAIYREDAIVEIKEEPVAAPLPESKIQIRFEPPLKSQRVAVPAAKESATLRSKSAASTEV
jgi:hypothetical protein